MSAPSLKNPHKSLPQRRLSLGAAALLLLACSGCEDINWPFHHRQVEPTPASGAGNAAECRDLLAQIRQSQEERREAAATSVNRDIVSAAQGKADQRIDALRQRYEEMDCPSDQIDATTRPQRQPPLPAASGVAAP